MKKNNLYKLNKDLLIKIIEDINNLEKLSDVELLLLKNRIEKETDKRDFVNADDCINNFSSSLLSKYLIDFKIINGDADIEMKRCYDYRKQNRITEEENKQCEKYLTDLGIVAYPYVNNSSLFTSYVKDEIFMFRNFDVRKYNKEWIKTTNKGCHGDIMMYPDPFNRTIFVYYFVDDEDKILYYDDVSQFEFFA